MVGEKSGVGKNSLSDEIASRDIVELVGVRVMNRVSQKDGKDADEN